MNKRKKMNFLRKNYVEKKNILNVHLIKIKEKENIDNIFYQLKLLIHSPQRIEAMNVTREMVLIKTRDGFDQIFIAKNQLGIYFA